MRFLNFDEMYTYFVVVFVEELDFTHSIFMGSTTGLEGGKGSFLTSAGGNIFGIIGGVVTIFGVAVIGVDVPLIISVLPFMTGAVAGATGFTTSIVVGEEGVTGAIVVPVIAQLLFTPCWIH